MILPRRLVIALLLLVPCGLLGQSRICPVGDYGFKVQPLSTKLLTAYQDSVLTIDVVVHVVANSIFTDISDDAVHEQIEVLNQDYNRQNPDTLNVPSIFRHLAGDAGIQFQLASKDPEGNDTDGILRIRTTIGNFWTSRRLQTTSRGGSDPWDQSRYLNIWVTQLGLPGYASTPDSVGVSRQDGVMIDYTAFGTSGRVRPPFLRGRTTTHEIGHYLGLKHIWGPTGRGCLEDDGIEDTPNQISNTPPNSVGCSLTRESCGSRDMQTNFMDYTDDICMNLFTHQQALRMRNTLLTLRSSLLDQVITSSETLPANLAIGFDVFPNPSSGLITVEPKSLLGEKTSLRVLDLSGRGILTRLINQSGRINIELPDLPSGIYIVELQSGDRRSSRYVQLVR